MQSRANGCSKTMYPIASDGRYHIISHAKDRAIELFSRPVFRVLA